MRKINQVGYTLIELVVVIAIIGIISSVAVPSYLDYIVRTNRADAKDELTKVIYELERFNTRNRSYTTNLADLGFTPTAGSIPTKKGLYRVSVAACGAAASEVIARCAIATATPVAGRGQEGDGNLTLDTRGRKNDRWED